MEYVLYIGLSPFWCFWRCCKHSKGPTCILLCTGSAWWGREAGEEVMLYTSWANQAFLFLVLATVWKVQPCSWQSGMYFLSAISKREKNKYGNFFVVKIVTQWNHISSFFFSWWNLKPTRHRFLNLNYACKGSCRGGDWSQQNRGWQDVLWFLRDRAEKAGGGEGDTPPSVESWPATRCCPWRKLNSELHR